MQGAVGLLAKIVGVAVVTHWSGGSWNVTTLCSSVCWKGTTLCSSGGSSLGEVRGICVPLTNTSRCSARVRITVSVLSRCVSFGKVSCISSDNLLTCVLLEKGGQCSVAGTGLQSRIHNNQWSQVHSRGGSNSGLWKGQVAIHRGHVVPMMHPSLRCPR